MLRNSDAQLVAKNATPAKYFTFTIDSNSVPKIADSYKLNNISIRATRDLLSRYKNAGNTLWYKVDNGLIAKFVSGEKSLTITYTSAGRWLYTITGYDEKSMPKEVRSIVKRTYYDFDIVHVAEVQVPDTKSHIYLVYVQDAEQINVLRICDGEMQVLYDYTRG